MNILNLRFAALAVGLIASALGSPGAQAAGTISIVAGYDYSSPTYIADSFFTVTNTSGSTLSSMTFTSVGDGSLTASDVATWTWTGVSIASGSSYTLYFPTTGTGVTGSGYGFTADYEYLLEGNDQSYTFSGLVGATASSATFSPTTNATGSFVAFLGNDADGDSLPANVSATVATIGVATVPEPATAALLLAGLLSVGFIRRRRLALADVQGG